MNKGDGMQNFDVKQVEKIIGYTFKNKNLLKSAFIHSSYANEHRETKSNERLEFLGDSVLSVIVTNYIFVHYKNNEGDMSKIRSSLVSEKSLSFVFENLNLAKYIIVGVGLKNSNPTNAMMADAFEALTAAIYLDGGIESATTFVLSVLDSALEDINETGVPESNKSLLQEKYKTAKIRYETTHDGEGQDKTYTAVVYINNVASGKGVSQKKRFAEDIAAKEALKKVKKR